MSEAYREIFDIKTGEVVRQYPKKTFVNKQWDAMTDADKDQLRDHLTTFDTEEKAMGYKKYLRDMCKVPAAWLNIPIQN